MFSQHLECAHFIRQMFANFNETVEKILTTDPTLLACVSGLLRGTTLWMSSCRVARQEMSVTNQI